MTYRRMQRTNTPEQIDETRESPHRAGAARRGVYGESDSESFGNNTRAAMNVLGVTRGRRPYKENALNICRHLFATSRSQLLARSAHTDQQRQQRLGVL